MNLCERRDHDDQLYTVELFQPGHVALLFVMDDDATSLFVHEANDPSAAL